VDEDEEGGRRMEVEDGGGEWGEEEGDGERGEGEGRRKGERWMCDEGMCSDESDEWES